MDIHYFIIIYYLAKNKIVIFILEVYVCVCVILKYVTYIILD